VVLVMIVAACAGPVVSAAVELVEILAVAAAVLLVLGVVVAVVVWRVRRRRARAARPVAPLSVIAVRAPGELPGARPAPAAIEPPRIRVSAYPRIDAQPHVVTGRNARPRCARRDVRRS
jgi:hypothetical protein